jgi:hypothetical protein
VPRFGFVLLVACLAIVEAAAAQEVAPRPDLLFVSGRIDVFDTGGTGGGGGLEWLHPVAERGALDVGAFAFSYLDSRWSYGKLGGYYLLRKETTMVTGEANVGTGEGARGDFTYQIYKLGLSQALIVKRLYVTAEDQYVHVARVEENLLNLGVIAYPMPALSARVNYYLSTGGNVSSSWLVGRLDWSIGRVTLIGGFAVGHATHEQFNVITDTRRAVRTEEGFGGISFPIGGQELTLVVDAVRQPAVERIGALFSWKIPF